MKLGVCFYPEHWPEADWAEDARMMRELGLSLVRIGEFAWSRIEPRCARRPGSVGSKSPPARAATSSAAASVSRAASASLTMACLTMALLAASSLQAQGPFTARKNQDKLNDPFGQFGGFGAIGGRG